MAKLSKRTKAIRAKVELNKSYPIDAALIAEAERVLDRLTSIRR